MGGGGNSPVEKERARGIFKYGEETGYPDGLKRTTQKRNSFSGRKGEGRGNE